MIAFIAFASGQGYKTEAKEKLKNNTYPYKLQISKFEKVNLPAISKITLSLRKQATRCNGSYDGWETFVIKE